MKKITYCILVFCLFLTLPGVAQSDPTSFYIRGTGFNRSVVRVLKIGDETIYSASSRGLRLTVISKSDLSVVSDVTYDTYSSSTSSNELAEQLNSIEKTQIGILTSYDAWESNVTTTLKSAFLRCGLTIASSCQTSSIRKPYAAVFDGASNEENAGKAVEVCFTSSANMPFAEITGYFYNGSFLASGNRSNALLYPYGNNVGVMVNYNGNVGIGTSSPSSKLEVVGTITADEIVVEDIAANNLKLDGNLAADKIMVNANGNTADFVFEENYNLKDLSEIEKYIKIHKHLPDIPSAEEMEKEGVDLAEMNKLLLQKIEELTLYLLENEKELNRMKSDILQMKKSKSKSYENR